MKLEQLVGKLLLNHDCVIVPDFGGFVCSRKAAQINPKGVITPPYKSILFNRQLILDDGLLIHAYAKESGQSYESSRKAISELKDQWYRELNDGKRLEFEQLGFLYFDNDKKLHFEQDRFHNLLLESYGMGDVNFIPVVEKEKVQVQQTAEQKAPVESKPEVNKEQDEAIKITTGIAPIVSIQRKSSPEKVAVKSVDSSLRNKANSKTASKKDQHKPQKENSGKKGSGRRLIKYAAAACMLPIAFYSVWIPMKTDVLQSGLISAHDFNPFYQEAKAIYHPAKELPAFEQTAEWASLDQHLHKLPESVDYYAFDLFENDRFLKVAVKGEEPKNIESSKDDPEISTQIKETEQQVSMNHTMTSGSIRVIVGSFSNQENARQLTSDLKTLGFEAFTFGEESGLTRVAAGRFQSLDAAQKAVSDLSAQGKASWILK